MHGGFTRYDAILTEFPANINFGGRHGEPDECLNRVTVLVVLLKLDEELGSLDTSEVTDFFSCVVYEPAFLLAA